LVQSDWGFPAILRDYYEDLYCDSINHQKPYEIIKIMVDSMFLEPNTFDYQRYNKENKDVTFVLDDDVFKTKDSSVVIGGLFFTDIAYSKDKNFFGVYYNYLSYRKGEKSKGESVYFKKDTTSGKFIYSHKVEAFQQETKQKGIGLGITLKLREDFKKDFCPCCPR
jgi:hypothetical protein